MHLQLLGAVLASTLLAAQEMHAVDSELSRHCSQLGSHGLQVPANPQDPTLHVQVLLAFKTESREQLKQSFSKGPLHVLHNQWQLSQLFIPAV